MNVRIDVEGSSELRAALRNMSDDIRSEVRNVVMKTAITLQADIKRSIRKKGTGTIYYRIYDADSGWTNIYAGDSEGYVTSIKGRANLSPTHQASKGGEPPASDTGRLLNSIQWDVSGDLAATVFSILKYAAWLEYGTTQMAERPFFTPAANKARKQFNKDIRRVVLGETR